MLIYYLFNKSNRFLATFLTYLSSSLLEIFSNKDLFVRFLQEVSLIFGLLLFNAKSLKISWFDILINDSTITSSSFEFRTRLSSNFILFVFFSFSTAFSRILWFLEDKAISYNKFSSFILDNASLELSKYSEFKAISFNLYWFSIFWVAISLICASSDLIEISYNKSTISSELLFDISLFIAFLRTILSLSFNESSFKWIAESIFLIASLLT